jgi:beta-xylosidase
MNNLDFHHYLKNITEEKIDWFKLLIFFLKSFSSHVNFFSLITNTKFYSLHTEPLEKKCNLEYCKILMVKIDTDKELTPINQL